MAITAKERPTPMPADAPFERPRLEDGRVVGVVVLVGCDIPNAAVLGKRRERVEVDVIVVDVYFGTELENESEKGHAVKRRVIYT